MYFREVPSGTGAHCRSGGNPATRRQVKTQNIGWREISIGYLLTAIKDRKGQGKIDINSRQVY